MILSEMWIIGCLAPNAVFAPRSERYVHSFMSSALLTRRLPRVLDASCLMILNSLFLIIQCIRPASKTQPTPKTSRTTARTSALSLPLLGLSAFTAQRS